MTARPHATPCLVVAALGTALVLSSCCLFRTRARDPRERPTCSFKTSSPRVTAAKGPAVEFDDLQLLRNYIVVGSVSDYEHHYRIQLRDDPPFDVAFSVLPSGEVSVRLDPPMVQEQSTGGSSLPLKHADDLPANFRAVLARICTTPLVAAEHRGSYRVIGVQEIAPLLPPDHGGVAAWSTQKEFHADEALGSIIDVGDGMSGFTGYGRKPPGGYWVPRHPLPVPEGSLLVTIARSKDPALRASLLAAARDVLAGVPGPSIDVVNAQHESGWLPPGFEPTTVLTVRVAAGRDDYERAALRFKLREALGERGARGEVSFEMRTVGSLILDATLTIPNVPMMPSTSPSSTEYSGTLRIGLAQQGASIWRREIPVSVELWQAEGAVIAPYGLHFADRYLSTSQHAELQTPLADLYLQWELADPRDAPGDTPFR